MASQATPAIPEQTTPVDETTETDGTKLSRRNVAATALWATPVVIASVPAPAMAASNVIITANVCELFYGSGTINVQTHSIYWGISSDTGTIPAGTVVTYSVTVDPTTNPDGLTDWEIPTNMYPGGYTVTSTNGPWYISYSPARGTAMTGTQTFTVTITFNQDYVGNFCAASIWNDTYTLRPASTITISGPTVTGALSAGSMGLKYRSARRYPTAINSTGRLPRVFQTKVGTQSCFPPVQYSILLSRTGFDNVTTYPSGTTLTNPCAWDGLGCAGTTGPSIPREGVVQTSQFVANVC